MATYFKNNFPLKSAALVLTFMGSLAFWAGCDSSGTKPEQKTPDSVSRGEPAPSPKVDKSVANDAVKLDLADENDFQALLEKNKGKVILVDFWATWCGPCTEQFPHTVATHEKLKDQGLTVITVSVDDVTDSKKVETFLQDNKATCINLMSKYGGDEGTFEKFDLDGGAVPHYKIYDKTGKLVKKFSVDPKAEKSFTSEDIDALVHELLAK